jgi:hypothetical protein
MMAEAGTMDETFREYERIVDPKYLQQMRSRQRNFPQSSCPAGPDLLRTQSENSKMDKYDEASDSPKADNGD